MIRRWLHSQHAITLKFPHRPQYGPLRELSTSTSKYAPSPANTDTATAALSRTRNIGIIAHIDAGKTTTTERMLYYSGFTRRIGDVDDGSTVTDFLPAERARGITIQSAAITFQWPPSTSNKQQVLSHSSRRSSIPHNINLIDTPGHADFTFEVLRSLRVLDGAVCILDGVAGVEAQTEKVWSQAAAYAIPRLLYVNKLDRDGAAFARTVREIASRLEVSPAVCGIPWWNSEGNLRGVGDVIGLRALRYPESGDGKAVDLFDLQELQTKDSKLSDELKKGRIALVELLSEHDDQMVEKYLDANEDHTAITAVDIIESLRRCVLHTPQIVAPVFAGASFRNTGVQPLLDAVVDLLPSPDERPDPEISFGSDVQGGLAALLSGSSTASQQTKFLAKDKATFSLQKLEACALAFKVVADAKRGALVYVRVYSGALSRNSALWNTTLQTMERAQRLLRMYANDAVEIESIESGQIGVIPGLKVTRTGDTLITYTGANPKTGPPPPITNLQLRPIDVPRPVFFVSVEPNSLAEAKHITESLELLLREDPSLYVSVDEESGQTHLSGMGELHLEIARDRLVNDLKTKARIGQIEIGYREALTAASHQVTETFDREVSGKSSKASCTAFVEPRTPGQIAPSAHTHVLEMLDNNNNNRVAISTPTLHADGSPINPEDSGLPAHLPLAIILQSIQTGASAALARGPKHTYPVHSTDVKIVLDPAKHIYQNTTPAAVASATRLAMQKALLESAGKSETVLMEPVMLVTVSVDEESMGSVAHDISSSRGGTVVSLDIDGTEEDSERSSIDVSRIYTPPDPFADAMTTDSATNSRNAMREVVARVPLKEMVGYLKHLRSLTGGRGTFTMVVDQFERMSTQRQRSVLNEMRGDYI